MKIDEAVLLELRRQAEALLEPGLSAVEEDRRQRMLVNTCQKVADRHGLDAPTLYHAAIHYAGEG